MPLQNNGGLNQQKRTLWNSGRKVIGLITGGAVMKDRTQRWNAVIWISVAGALVLTGLPGCEPSQPVAVEAKKEPPAVSAMSEPAAGEMKPDLSAAVTEMALMAPVGSSGRMANDEGVSHAQQGHWDVAEGHFRKAVEADPRLAEAQFNLGLALDKLNRHDEAKVAFKKAAELAPGNTKITESEILKKHTST